MPESYVKCRDALKAQGKSDKEAARICAIEYYKRTGKALPKDSKSGLLADQIPTDLSDEHVIDIADAAIVLNWLYDQICASRQAQTMPMSPTDMGKMMRDQIRNKRKMMKKNKTKMGDPMKGMSK